MKQAPHTGGPNGDTVIKTKAQRLRARIQFATLCWTFYLAGWNDGTTGPLLPRIQRVYGLSFAVVSLIFVSTCLGFLTGAFLNVALNDRYGFGKVVSSHSDGSILQAIGYTIEVPPYLFQCSYLGAGALSAPLVATRFAQLPHWSFHYLASLGIALTGTILLIAVFRLESREECLAQIGQPAGEQSQSEKNRFRQIFTLKNVHLLAVFILVYVGIEVTLGGWIVTYIADVRGGGPSSGYISSGFLGGLMTGRVALLWLNRKVGERRVLFIYALLAVGLELVVWFVPSLIGGAVSVSIIGVLLGPMYPIAMNHAGRVLPAWLLTGSIGWIAGGGQAGSALLPFMTGAICSPCECTSLCWLVAMMVLMMVLWALVPSKGLRRMD
ncbi:major facilitator superfamily domain-containing protein [Boletus coccyginus]|nr:major facilitator superfamily domain-containing protein [Boletus coccyginus]